MSDNPAPEESNEEEERYVSPDVAAAEGGAQVAFVMTLSGTEAVEAEETRVGDDIEED